MILDEMSLSTLFAAVDGVIPSFAANSA